MDLQFFMVFLKYKTDFGIGLLIRNGQVKRLIASFVGENTDIEKKYLAGEMELELVPQGCFCWFFFPLIFALFEKAQLRKRSGPVELEFLLSTLRQGVKILVSFVLCFYCSL